MGVAAAVLAGFVAVLLTGCAAAEEPDVERMAAAFAGADPAARCALLAPATAAVVAAAPQGCPAVVGRLPAGSVLTAQVWGDRAQARTTADTLFLVRTAAGWRVAAAGCRPSDKGPYACAVIGP